MTVLKCVVWDLDGTVWPGVALERTDGLLPEPFPRALAAMDELEARGVVNSAASRTDPSLAPALERHPELGRRLVAPQLNWGDKAASLAAVAETLGVSPDSLLLVDDNPFERAQTAALLPGTPTLAPGEFYERLESGALAPEPSNPDAARRAERYRQELLRRQAEREFEGDREAFLRSCEMVVTAGAVEPVDLPRVAELAERTSRFNSSGRRYSRAELQDLADDPLHLVAAARLVDRFGDYGLISAAVVRRGERTWRLRLFTTSCRVAGRDVPIAMLSWLAEHARAAGARRMSAEVDVDLANVELRLLLRRAGFVPEPSGGAAAAVGDEPEHGMRLLARPLTTPLPTPDHLRIDP